MLVSTHEDSRSHPRIPCQVGVADSLYPSLGRQRKGVLRANWLTRLAMSPNSEFWGALSQRTSWKRSQGWHLTLTSGLHTQAYTRVCPHACKHVHYSCLQHKQKGMTQQPPCSSSTKFNPVHKPIKLPWMSMHEIPRQLKIHTDRYDSLTTPVSNTASDALGEKQIRPSIRVL